MASRKKNSPPEASALQRLADILRSGQPVVFVTGSGISARSRREPSACHRTEHRGARLAVSPADERQRECRVQDEKYVPPVSPVSPATSADPMADPDR